MGYLGRRGLLTTGVNAKVEGVICEAGSPHRIFKVATPRALGGYVSPRQPLCSRTPPCEEDGAGESMFRPDRRTVVGYGSLRRAGFAHGSLRRANVCTHASVYVIYVLSHTRAPAVGYSVGSLFERSPQLH